MFAEIAPHKSNNNIEPIPPIASTKTSSNMGYSHYDSKENNNIRSDDRDHYRRSSGDNCRSAMKKSRTFGGDLQAISDYGKRVPSSFTKPPPPSVQQGARPRKTMAFAGGKRPTVAKRHSQQDIDALLARSERKNNQYSRRTDASKKLHTTTEQQQQHLVKLRLHRIKRRLLLERATNMNGDSERTLVHANNSNKRRDDSDDQPDEDFRGASYNSFPDYSDDSSQDGEQDKEDNDDSCSSSDSDCNGSRQQQQQPSFMAAVITMAALGMLADRRLLNKETRQE